MAVLAEGYQRASHHGTSITTMDEAHDPACVHRSSTCVGSPEDVSLMKAGHARGKKGAAYRSPTRSRCPTLSPPQHLSGTSAMRHVHVPLAQRQAQAYPTSRPHPPHADSPPVHRTASSPRQQATNSPGQHTTHSPGLAGTPYSRMQAMSPATSPASVTRPLDPSKALHVYESPLVERSRSPTSPPYTAPRSHSAAIRTPTGENEACGPFQAPSPDDRFRLGKHSTGRRASIPSERHPKNPPLGASTPLLGESPAGAHETSVSPHPHEDNGPFPPTPSFRTNVGGTGPSGNIHGAVYWNSPHACELPTSSSDRPTDHVALSGDRTSSVSHIHPVRLETGSPESRPLHVLIPTASPTFERNVFFTPPPVRHVSASNSPKAMARPSSGGPQRDTGTWYFDPSLRAVGPVAGLAIEGEELSVVRLTISRQLRKRLRSRGNSRGMSRRSRHSHSRSRSRQGMRLQSGTHAFSYPGINDSWEGHTRRTQRALERERRRERAQERRLREKARRMYRSPNTGPKLRAVDLSPAVRAVLVNKDGKSKVGAVATESPVPFLDQGGSAALGMAPDWDSDSRSSYCSCCHSSCSRSCFSSETSSVCSPSSLRRFRVQTRTARDAGIDSRRGGAASNAGVVRRERSVGGRRGTARRARRNRIEAIAHKCEQFPRRKRRLRRTRKGSKTVVFHEVTDTEADDDSSGDNMKRKPNQKSNTVDKFGKPEIGTTSTWDGIEAQRREGGAVVSGTRDAVKTIAPRAESENLGGPGAATAAVTNNGTESLGPENTAPSVSLRTLPTIQTDPTLALQQQITFFSTTLDSDNAIAQSKTQVSLPNTRVTSESSHTVVFGAPLPAEDSYGDNVASASPTSSGQHPTRNCAGEVADASDSISGSGPTCGGAEAKSPSDEESVSAAPSAALDQPQHTAQAEESDRAPALPAFSPASTAPQEHQSLPSQLEPIADSYCPEPTQEHPCGAGPAQDSSPQHTQMSKNKKGRVPLASTSIAPPTAKATPVRSAVRSPTKPASLSPTPLPFTTPSPLSIRRSPAPTHARRVLISLPHSHSPEGSYLNHSSPASGMPTRLASTTRGKLSTHRTGRDWRDRADASAKSCVPASEKGRGRNHVDRLPHARRRTVTDVKSSFHHPTIVLQNGGSRPSLPVDKIVVTHVEIKSQDNPDHAKLLKDTPNLDWIYWK